MNFEIYLRNQFFKFIQQAILQIIIEYDQVILFLLVQILCFH